MTFKSATRGHPCPLCEGIDGCSQKEDGLFCCRRRQGPQAGFVFLGEAKTDPQWNLYRREGDARLNGNGNGFHRQLPKPPPKPEIDWKAKAALLARDLTPERARDLAGTLGLTVDSLSCIPLLGFSEAEQAWTSPEENGNGHIIGIMRRFADGSKMAMKEAGRGLTVPAGWRDREGAILLCEGLTDVLALSAMGLACLGRPSNTGGVEALAELLRDVPTDRRVIVLGEYDQKPDGKWPGKDGAAKVAGELAAKLGRVVSWAMPSNGSKDSRAWINAKNLPTAEEGMLDDWQAAGEDFLAGLKCNYATPHGNAPAEDPPPAPPPAPTLLKDLIAANPSLRAPIVHGLLREGETMNVIASPKTGKSWLTVDLALAIATGTSWLGFSTVKGNVLILDNELHNETIANRVPRVAAARGIDMNEIGDAISIQTLRGKLADILKLGAYFDQFEPGLFKPVMLDALYRFLPVGTNENDNAQMAAVYNQLDYYADKLKCAFVCVHHASKGSQTNKSITDTGAGAGAQSRAVDAHLVLRPHEQDGVVSLEAACRSWPPINATCLRWEFPCWQTALDIDPSLLKGAGAKRQAAAEKEAEAETRVQTDAAKVLHALSINDPNNNGVTFTQLRNASGIAGTARFGGAVTWLLDNGKLRQESGMAMAGKGARKPAKILTRIVELLS